MSFIKRHYDSNYYFAWGQYKEAMVKRKIPNDREDVRKYSEPCT